MSSDERWHLVREPLADYRIFRVLRMRGTSPRTGKDVVYHGLEMVDWVQVIARTESGRLLMVEQFRPGTERYSLEFAAGMVDGDESPEEAARRELLEETGFEAAAIHNLGALYPNPAIQSNLLHVLFAEGCRQTAEPQPDDGEDLSVRLVDEAEIPVLIENRRIDHALVVAAWQVYESWRVHRSASRT